ncbi:MAG: hypothetical protein RL023_697 [Candidatus Parcubacteria bacterium]
MIVLGLDFIKRTSFRIFFMSNTSSSILESNHARSKFAWRYLTVKSTLLLELGIFKIFS